MFDMMFLAVLSALPFPFLHLSVLCFTSVHEFFATSNRNSAILDSMATNVSKVLEQSIIGEVNATDSLISGLNDYSSYIKTLSSFFFNKQ